MSKEVHYWGLDRRQFLRLAAATVAEKISAPYFNRETHAEEPDWEGLLRQIYTPPDYQAGIDRAWKNVESLLEHPFDGFLVPADTNVNTLSTLQTSVSGEWRVVRDPKYPQDTKAYHELRKLSDRVVPNTLYELPKVEYSEIAPQAEVTSWGYQYVNGWRLSVRQRNGGKILLPDIYPSKIPEDINQARVSAINYTNVTGEHGINVLSVMAAIRNNQKGIVGMLNDPQVVLRGVGYTPELVSVDEIQRALTENPDCRVAVFSFAGPVGPTMIDAMRNFSKNGLIIAGANNSEEPTPVNAAALYAAIIVGSIGQTGERVQVNTPSDNSVHIFAPGKDIPVIFSDGTVRNGDGNSFATPHIAALTSYLLGLGATKPATLYAILSGGRRNEHGVLVQDCERSLNVYGNLSPRRRVFLPAIYR